MDCCDMERAATPIASTAGSGIEIPHDQQRLDGDLPPPTRVLHSVGSPIATTTLGTPRHALA